MSGVFTLPPEATFLLGGVRPFYGVCPGKRSGAAVQRETGLDMVPPPRTRQPLSRSARGLQQLQRQKTQ